MIFREYARDDFKEVSRYRGVWHKYDQQHEFFHYLLKHLKKTAKQAFDSKAKEYVSALLFGKPPIAIENHLSVADKQDATLDETRDFIRRRYQHQPLLGTQQPQSFNEVSIGPDKRQNDRPIRDDAGQQNKFSGTYFHCNKEGHKAIECRTRKRELAKNDISHNESSDPRPQPTQNKPA